MRRYDKLKKYVFIIETSYKSISGSTYIHNK